MAMLVVALAASVAGFMAWQQSLWVRQAENLSNLAQADAIARAAGHWIQLILADGAKRGSADFQAALLANALPAVPVEHGEAAIGLVDLQGRYNLNNLVANGKVSPNEVAAFRRLLDLLNLSPDLANAIVDWIDADGEPTFPGGAEDADYLAATPPYRAANQPMLEIDELARVKGFDAASLAKLKPFVTALPAPTTVNLNAASAEVLSALLPRLSLIEARTFVAARRDRPFKDLDEVHSRYPELETPRERFATGGQYYLATASAHFDRATVAYQMLLARSSKGGVQLVWQKPVAY